MAAPGRAAAALIGFGLLTAATSWVLQVYPALSRRRALAIRLTLLDRAGAASALPAAEAATAAALLDGLAAEIVRVRVDLTAQDATYYFVDGDRTTSLAAALGSAIELADTGRVAGAPDVRSAAAVLHCALDDLAQVLDEEFLDRRGTTTEVLAAWAADHGHGSD